MFRQIRIVLVTIFVLMTCSLGFAQSAQIQGQVTDTTGAVIQKAAVRVVDQQTNTERSTVTNGSGEYAVPGLIPGIYKIFVQAPGFSGAISNAITLNVAQNAVLDFKLKIGSASTDVHVDAGNIEINTTDGSVSTVVDREFVENLPLNGRSFQSLIYSTPGVMFNVNTGGTAGTSVTSSGPGQFTVNGQRGDANYWTVDGVSGNVAAGGGMANEGVGGSIGGGNILGGTNSLVSIDALQEFRIVTSSYAPEYGREPGAQIVLETRGGTNKFHGTAFDYLRNTDLDARDWFVDHDNLPKPAEIQNDFGGVFDGPIFHDKSFFFFSAELLRLILPYIYQGDVFDTATRQNAVASMQPYLNVYPVPLPSSVPVPGNPGLVTYNTTFSQPGKADAYSLRLDQQLPHNITLFARANYAPSKQTVQGYQDAVTANNFLINASNTKSITAGATWAPNPKVADEFRYNYTKTGGSSSWSLSNFGGGTSAPADEESLMPSGYNYSNAVIQFVPSWGNGLYQIAGLNGGSFAFQQNIVDSLSWQKGTHSIKVGVDYRHFESRINTDKYLLDPFFCCDTPQNELTQILDGTPYTTLVESYPSSLDFLLQNLGAYGQDTWRVNSRLTLTYGLRWDVDFMPSAVNGTYPVPAVTGFNLTDFSQLAAAPSGTPAYSTRWGNVAPRVGGAYQVSNAPGKELVVRGGFGIFYGLASDNVASRNLYANYPYQASAAAFNLPNGCVWPTPASCAALPPANLQRSIVAIDPHLNLPYALEFDGAVEQALGQAQTLKISYVGSRNSREIQTATIFSPNPNYDNVVMYGNTGTASYDSLQVVFQRRLANGLQALASYTWGHSIDNGSYTTYNNGLLGSTANRGNSDYDVRQAFTGDLTYYVPAWKANVISRAITSGWSTDDVLQFRTGPPVDIVDGDFQALTTSHSGIVVRADTVPGQPKYISDPNAAGGKRINPNYFTDPPTTVLNGVTVPTQQGDLARNAFRALGLSQWDLAVHREFPIYGDKLKLQFRAELFNAVNHPNFAPYSNNWLANGGNPQFGYSEQMENQLLGNVGGGGGQNPLYTPGGPRSGEFALKLIF